MIAEGSIIPKSREEFMAAINRFVMGTNDGLIDVFLEQAAAQARSMDAAAASSANSVRLPS
jgi:hypothetical protein